jgi:hypothetical protein
VARVVWMRYDRTMHYLITAYHPNRTTVHKARSEEAALKLMDRLHYADIHYGGSDSCGNAIDENGLTDIIDARTSN